MDEDAIEADKVFGSRPYTTEAWRKNECLKLRGYELLKELETIQPNSDNARYIALARTKLEECVMWANKAVSRESLRTESTEE